jgi:hypothetical protein
LRLDLEQILLAQFAERVADQVLTYPRETGKLGHVALSIAMPPDAGCDRGKAMAHVAVFIVDEELRAECLYKQSILTCSR